MQILIPNPVTPSTPLSFNLDGRVLRSILNALPATPPAPAHYTNDLAEVRDNGDGTTTNMYARRFNTFEFPEHADVVYLDQKEGEQPWNNGVVTLLPGDPQYAIVTPEGTVSLVRHRAVNPKGEVLSSEVTIS